MSKATCNIVYVKKDYLTIGDTAIVLEKGIYHIGIFRGDFTDIFYPEKSRKYQNPFLKVEPMIATKSKNKNLLVDIFGQKAIYNEVITKIPKTTITYSFKQTDYNFFCLFKIPDELYILKKLPPNTKIQLWK
jgi:hypothetical protein